MAAKKGKLRSVEHKVHDDHSVSFEIYREPTGTNKGSFLMDRQRETGTHRTAKEAGDHLRKVLREHGVKDSHGSDSQTMEGKGKKTASNPDKNRTRGEQGGSY